MFWQSVAISGRVARNPADCSDGSSGTWREDKDRVPGGLPRFGEGVVVLHLDIEHDHGP